MSVVFTPGRRPVTICTNASRLPSLARSSLCTSTDPPLLLRRQRGIIGLAVETGEKAEDRAKGINIILTHEAGSVPKGGSDEGKKEMIELFSYPFFIQETV